MPFYYFMLPDVMVVSLSMRLAVFPEKKRIGLRIR
jgi:hypothetical protein